MNVLSRNKIILLMLFLFLAMPLTGMAQDPMSGAPSLQEMAQNGTKATNAIGILVQAVVCLVGFILVCMGLYGFYRVNKEKGQGQHSIGAALVGCVVGMFMFVLPLTIGSLGQTMFGDKMKRPDMIQLAPSGTNP